MCSPGIIKIAYFRFSRQSKPPEKKKEVWYLVFRRSSTERTRNIDENMIKEMKINLKKTMIKCAVRLYAERGSYPVDDWCPLGV